jgi:hypothetical protein
MVQGVDLEQGTCDMVILDVGQKNRKDRHRIHPKWDPILYIVNYFRPEPYSLYMVPYFRPEPYGTLFPI